jgi:hypothetical protein
MHELPEYRAPALQREIDLLNLTLDGSFVLPADRDRDRLRVTGHRRWFHYGL